MKLKKQDREFPGGPVVHIFTAEGTGLIPGQETKIPPAQMAKQKNFLNKKMKWALIHHLLNRRGGRMPCEGTRDYKDISTSQGIPGATRD